MKQNLKLYIYSANMILFGQLITVGPLIPIIASNLQIQELEMGFIFSFRGSGMLIGCFGCKFIENQIESHRLLGISSLFTSIMMILINLTKNWLQLGLIFFTLGLFMSIFEVYINTLAIQLGKQTNSQTVSIVHAFFALGSILQPIIIANLNQFSFYLLSIESFMIFIFYIFIQDNTNSHKYIENNQNQVELIQQCEEMRRDIRYILVIFYFLYVGIEIGFGSWLPTYCYKNNYLDLKQSAQSPSIFWLTIFIGRSAGVYLGNYSALQMMLYQTILCLVTLILSALLIQFNFIKTGIYFACIFYGLGMSSLYPLGLNIGQELKMAVSVNLSADLVISGCLGDIFVPYIMGSIMNNFGIQLFYPQLIFISILILIIPLYLSFVNKKFNQKNNQNLKLIELSNY